jgi:hypothetical protein
LASEYFGPFMGSSCVIASPSKLLLLATVGDDLQQPSAIESTVRGLLFANAYQCSPWDGTIAMKASTTHCGAHCAATFGVSQNTPHLCDDRMPLRR